MRALPDRVSYITAPKPFSPLEERHNAQTDLNSPFKRGEGYWKVPAAVERPGSASADAFAVPAAPDVGDLFNFATGGAAPALPGGLRAPPPLRPPEWERMRPYLSGAFLLQVHTRDGPSRP